MSKKSQTTNLDWSSIHKKVEGILGDQFWQDIHQMIPSRYPNCDIYETDSTGVVVVELPGLVSPNDVSIRLEGNSLTIEGLVPVPYPIAKSQLKVRERHLGSFSRTLRLPFHYSKDTPISARYKNGLLEIHIPKQEEENSIPIEFED
ncbi:MAG TPA: Hsp20/alpha crystallin family protein [Bacillus sp. (in: firmicutes)]|nr:Hsp20/alpha crystallin family protein [Bacillus sp. (in: firmicutes)]